MASILPDRGWLRAHHLALISMIIGFLSGYDSGVAGGILTFDSFATEFGTGSQVSSLTVSLQVLGAFLSCFVASLVTEKLGRRYGIMVFGAVFIVGVVLQTAPTNNLGAWYFSRIWAGIGQGGLTVIVPVFTAEMAPSHLRGRLGSFYQWMYTLGIFTAYWINYGINQNIDLTTAAAWQIPVSLQMVSGTILVAGMFTVPESVRWLAKKGRYDEAWASLAWIRASDDALVKAEFEEIKRGVEEEAEERSGLQWSEMVNHENRGRVVSGCLAMIFQQATGGSALAYFSPQFFAIIVGDGDRDLLLTALFGAVKLIACTFFILFVAARVGRRWPLIIGGVVLFMCLFPVSMIQKYVSVSTNAGEEPVPPTGIAVVFLVFLNVMVYNMSWGPVPWVYVPEIFSNRTRERGMGICLTCHWLFNFVFTFSTPYMIAGTGQNGYGTFLFYAIMDLIMAGWAFFFMKETSGKSLERVQREIDHRGLAQNKVDDVSDGENHRGESIEGSKATDTAI